MVEERIGLIKKYFFTRRFIHAALANTVGPEIQIVKSVVRVETVRCGRSPGAHPKTNGSGDTVRETRRRRSAIRGGRAGHDGTRLFPVEGERSLVRSVRAQRDQT